MSKRKAGCLVCILTLILSMAYILSEGYTCYANAGDKVLGMTFKVAKGNIETTITRTDRGASIKINKPYDAPGYSFVYQYRPENWSEFGALVIGMENTNDFSVDINLNIEDANGNRFSLADGSLVFLEGLTDEDLHAREVLETLKIPAGFKGRIYAVFRNFECKDDISKTAGHEFNKITTWGITIIPPQDQSSSEIVIKNAALLRRKSAVKYDNYSKIRLAGDEEMQLPVFGETIAQYQILNKEPGDKIEFSFPEDYSGTSVSEAGVVRLTTDVISSEISLNVRVNEELIIEKKIDLFKSWSIGKKSDDGVDFALQSPDSASYEKNSKFADLVNGSIFYARMILSGISIGLIMVLRYWKKRTL
ncbi:MAG: hypothetical protein WBH44_11495 [Proteocatella sp.]